MKKEDFEPGLINFDMGSDIDFLLNENKCLSCRNFLSNLPSRIVLFDFEQNCYTPSGHLLGRINEEDIFIK